MIEKIFDGRMGRLKRAIEWERGRMAERLKASALKAEAGQTVESSNLSPSSKALQELVRLTEEYGGYERELEDTAERSATGLEIQGAANPG